MSASAIFGLLDYQRCFARDWQFHTPTFTMGKSFRHSTALLDLGIVTADEIKNPNDLELKWLCQWLRYVNTSASEMITASMTN